MQPTYKLAGVLFLALISLTSCATYHISTESLLTQFANAQPEKKVNFIVAFPLVFPGVVTGNNLRQIKVLDKNEQERVLPVTRAMGIRITKKDGTKKTFYFDTLIIKDSIITGKNDHFIGVNIKPINLNTISKIELQR